MTIRFGKTSRTLFPTLALLVVGSTATANTLNQNVSWTVNRANTATKYRIVAYGDSIYAGYNGSTVNAARYSAPTVDAEYLSAPWNADIESIRRAKSGAVASDVYNNKIVAEKSYMQASSTRVVTFEMCGNDGLQARSSFKGQTGTCNYNVLTTAVNNCKTYVAAAMDFINANAYAGTKL
jgi:lysophospholipase L1-like esterase